MKSIDDFWKKGKLNPASNVQFGEGGAGTFSDGKLTSRVRDLRGRKVLEEFVKAGAPEDILYKAHPHVGTDLLRDIVKNIREQIIALGGEVLLTVKSLHLSSTKINFKGLFSKWSRNPLQSCRFSHRTQRTRYLC